MTVCSSLEGELRGASRDRDGNEAESSDGFVIFRFYVPGVGINLLRTRRGDRSEEVHEKESID